MEEKYFKADKDFKRIFPDKRENSSPEADQVKKLC